MLAHLQIPACRLRGNTTVARGLVVEDDSTNAIWIERVLSRMGGHEVSVTEDAYEVLAACEAGAELVVMDVSLSDTKYEDEPVDGIRIIELIREQMGETMPPVLLLTAHAMRGDRERLLELSGADDYLPKPIVDHQELVDVVARLLVEAAERKAA